MMKKVVALLLLLLMAGCTRTVYVPVEKEKEVIKYEYVNVHDTTYESHTEYITLKGDTVYKDKIIYKYSGKTQTIEKTDTITVVNDSIVYIPKEVEVIKYRQNGWGYLGWILLVLGILLIGYKRLRNVKNYIR